MIGARHRLHRVFAPQSIAVIGAKDSGRLFLGTGAVLQALDRLGYRGELHLVNRSGASVNGVHATRTVAELGAPIDMAAILVPAAAIPDVLPDALAAGTAGATLLASGLAERGAEGERLQAEIARSATRAGAELVGPNCLGFLNMVERTGVWFSGFPADLVAGPVAILSQSGGVGDALMEAAANLGVGVSHVITTGNEPTIAVADALEYLLEQEATRAIAVFAEAIRKPEIFIRAAARARELGKAIVMIKAGTSALGARNALSHTGSLAGDDVVTDVALRQLGVIRVHSLEELISTAHLAATAGPVGVGGAGIVALSGGGCSIFADAAERRGLPMPEFSAETTSALQDLVGDFGTAQNPFDVTAAANDSTFETAVGAIAAQPDISVVTVLCNVPTHQSGATPDVDRLLRSIATGASRVSKPVVLVAQTAEHLQEFGRARLAEAGIAMALPGIEIATSALAGVLSWSAWLTTPAPRLLSGVLTTGSSDDEGDALSEWESRARLAAHSVPMVEAELVHSADEAVRAWERFGSPVAVKGVSAAVAHKSDVGAVALGADDAAAVGEAFTRVSAAIRSVVDVDGDEGVIVAPMHGGGLELIAGVHRDAVWGPTLVVGFGGVLVEVLRDAAVRVLPVAESEVDEMLDELAGASLLRGVRGQPAVDRVSLLQAIGGIAELGGSADIRSVEVNPLVADEYGVIGLDALVIVGDRS
jgi:acyl-CoA synthetase (NDP forming)